MAYSDIYVRDYIHFCELNNIYITLSLDSRSTLKITPLENLDDWYVYSVNNYPSGFIWNNPEQTPISHQLIEWIKTEFIPLFNSNPFLWTVSVQTAPKELQCLLLGQTNNN